MKRAVYIILSILLTINLFAAVMYLLGGAKAGTLIICLYLSLAGFALVLIYVVFLLSKLHYKADDLDKKLKKQR